MGIGLRTWFGMTERQDVPWDCAWAFWTLKRNPMVKRQNMKESTSFTATNGTSELPVVKKKVHRLVIKGIGQ